MIHLPHSPAPHGAHETHDVVIAGARVAGAATAMLLARAGLDVLVVDRSDLGADTVSTHALMRGGVLQLRRWGLLDRIVDAGTPAIRHTTFRYASGDVRVPVSEVHGVDALYAPRRTVLDPILVEAATAAGAHVRHGVEVLDVVRDDGGVLGLVVRERDGRVHEIRAGLVVGADGIRSAVARLVGARTLRRGTAGTATTYAHLGGLDLDGAQWTFRRDGTWGAAPTNDGEWCVFAAGAPLRIGLGGIDVLADVVAANEPSLAAELRRRRHAMTRTFGGRPGHVREASGPGWALVGDASAFKDPIGAHGMTDALRDAELLARAIVDVAAGAAEAATLADYGRLRDELSTELFDVIDEIAAERWSDEEIPRLVRRMTAVTVPEVELLVGLPALGAVPA